jgi:hypothetical protein
MRSGMAPSLRVAHASRVLVIASSRSRTSFVIWWLKKRLLRRDAATNTRDACPTRSKFYRCAEDPI